MPHGEDCRISNQMTSVTDHSAAPRIIPRAAVPLAVLMTGLACLAGFGAAFVPQLDLLVHFQVQYAWVLTGCLLWLLATRRWGWAVAAGTVMLIPVLRIAPWYLDPPSPPAAGQPTIELLAGNVQYTNEQYGKFLELAEATDADIVIVQEATDAWARALSGLADRWPHQLLHPTPGPRGMLLLSRLPLSDTGVTLHPVTKHCILSATVEVGGRPIRILAAHPFRPGLRLGSRQLADELRQLGELAGDDTGDVVVIGDLNTTMWSDTYTTFVQDLGLTNLRQGAGILPSWSRVVPWLSAIPIDHCLIGDDLQGFAFGLLPIPGSDHDAVRAVVGFTAD